MRTWLMLCALFASLAAPAAAHDPAPLAVGEHQTVINGVRLWYRAAGRPAGAPVVFLHGGPGQGSQTFAKFAGPHLERDHRMVYFDQRGSGRSEKHWKKEYSLAVMVDDIEQLRRHLNVEQMALIGHSFGTVLALEYAAKYPQRVSHLVLAGAVVDFPAAIEVHCARLKALKPELYEKAVAEAPKGSSHRCNSFVAGREFIDGAMYPNPATMAIVDETDATDGMFNDGQISGALFKQGLLEYRFGLPDRLTMPVLVIGGARDFQAVVEPLRPFVAKVPGARLIEYEGLGHFMFVEDPQRFARDVTAFLRRR